MPRDYKQGMWAPGGSAAEQQFFPGESSAGARARHDVPASSSEPAVDDHLVEPESRWVVIDGERMHASPAKSPHADRQFSIDYALHPHLASGYVGATDLLTRWGEGNDFATDTSIRRDGIDPATGTRYLEELSFEVAYTQRRSELKKRAQTLIERGVRRVFAIFVKSGQVEEWSPTHNEFVPLALDGQIEDRCLRRPFKVRALLDKAIADEEVVHVLVARRHPVIEAIRAEERQGGFNDGRKQGLKDGRKKGQQELLLRLINAKFGDVPESFVQRVNAADDGQIERWADRVLTAETLDDVFAAS